MLRSGYWLTEYISISEIMHRAPVQYYRAFLYTETDENDLTYFILYHLQTVDRAIQELHAYIHRKTEASWLMLFFGHGGRWPARRRGEETGTIDVLQGCVRRGLRRPEE